MQTIEAFNAKRIDSSTERRSFVREPVILSLDSNSDTDNPGSRISVQKHPDSTVEGFREWNLGDSVAVQAPDAAVGNIRLKEYADIKVSGESAAVDSYGRSDNRPVVHWLPPEMGREAKLNRPEGKSIISESGLLEDFELEVGKVYQLERVGFAKLEELPENGPASLLWLHR